MSNSDVAILVPVRLGFDFKFRFVQMDRERSGFRWF